MSFMVPNDENFVNRLGERIYNDMMSVGIAQVTESLEQMDIGGDLEEVTAQVRAIMEGKETGDPMLDALANMVRASLGDARSRANEQAATVISHINMLLLTMPENK